MIPFQTILTPAWADYELLDTGNFRKLERFGTQILARPEPQAFWSPALPEAQWAKAAARFERQTGADFRSNKEDSGNWQFSPKVQERWFMDFALSGGPKLRFRLGLTAFKHVGIFPEQADNWQFIYDSLKAKPKGAKVLNLFAYTGGSSLAAAAAGADVTHVDAVKPVISWARENMEASGLEGIRWVVEDAFKFVQRECKRGHRYDLIILDPPAYGRGPKGEKWVLEQQLDALFQHCAELLAPGGQLLLNLYSMGISALVLDNLMQSHLPKITNYQRGELFLQDQQGRKLPLGIFLRF